MLVKVAAVTLDYRDKMVIESGRGQPAHNGSRGIFGRG